MNTRILALTAILVVLAGMTFVFPLGLVAADGRACPDDLCIINSAQAGGSGPYGLGIKYRCYVAPGGNDCWDCCDECANEIPWANVVGSCRQECSISEEYNIDCWS